MKKRGFLMVLCALSIAALASCASSADTMPSASPSPSVSPSMTPTTTITTQPTGTAVPETTATGVTTIEDAKSKADSISEELTKLSEVDSAEVVVAGNMALIGIGYDGQYQSGMTTRLTDMIDERVTAVDKSITVVHSTDDKQLVEEIKALKEQVDNGEITFSELQTRALEISASIAGGGQPSPSSTTGTGAGTGA